VQKKAKTYKDLAKNYKEILRKKDQQIKSLKDDLHKTNEQKENIEDDFKQSLQNQKSKIKESAQKHHIEF